MRYAVGTIIPDAVFLLETEERKFIFLDQREINAFREHDSRHKFQIVALESLKTLKGPFDLCFIDADKENYLNYYEAVLQIRGADKEKILEKIKKSNVLFYIRNVDKGYDVRLVKKHDAVKLTQNLEHCEVKRTFKLVGAKDGKNIYRVYYSVRGVQ